MFVKPHKLVSGTVLLLALLVLCAPSESAGMRVIFFAPRAMQLLTGQILSSSAREQPCEKCHMRDHRGNCRRMLSFNADGLKC